MISLQSGFANGPHRIEFTGMDFRVTGLGVTGGEKLSSTAQFAKACIPWSPKARDQGHPAFVFSSTWVGRRPMETRPKSCPVTKPLKLVNELVFPQPLKLFPETEHVFVAGPI